MKLSLFLAIKTIMRGDKGSLILTTLIMLVVFLNLLFIDAIFAGITVTMDNGKIDYQYGEVIIEPADGDRYIKNAPEVVDAITDFEYVQSVTARLTTGGVLVNDKDNDGRDVVRFRTGIIAIDPRVDNDVINIESNIIQGDYLQPDDYGKILLGADAAGGYGSSVFADDLEGVRQGDKLIVEFENDISVEYEIAGIYRTKNFEVDSKMMMLRDDFNKVFATTNEASEIIIRLGNRNLSQKMVAQLNLLGLGNYSISDWNEKLAFGRTINESFDKIGFILRVIGSFVAGLVIFIIIFVDIVNRRKQIGILKAIGIPESDIMYSYVLRGMFYTMIGIILGYLVMRFGIVNIFTAYPIDFPMGWMVPVIKEESLLASVALFIFAGLIGSFLPTIKEVRKKILILMR